MTDLDAARMALKELAADLVNDHRGIPYDVIERIDLIADPPECEREKWCDMPGGHSGECRNADDTLDAAARPVPDKAGEGHEQDCHNRTHIALDDAKDEIVRLKVALDTALASPPPLDVERLARALAAVPPTGTKYPERLAAEYARLTPASRHGADR